MDKLKGKAQKDKAVSEADKVMQMEQVIRNSYQNMGGLIVMRNGEIQYETYDEDSSADTTFHIFSVTKSIISILIGIAIDQGYIQSIEQKILEFFPDYKVKTGEQTIQNIRIRDLITMTAPYKYESEPYTEYFAHDNWVKSALDYIGGTGSIGDFRYAPLIGPDILSGILVKATGQSVLAFANDNLFSPLHIRVESNIVFQSKEEQLAWYNEKNVKGWVADKSGVNTAGWGLNLTTEAMAKIGQLYLNDGVWERQQIVSLDWVHESTSEHSRCEQWNLAYGYLWWVIDKKDHIFAAVGDGGNTIYVNAKKKLVVAIAAYFVPNAKDSISFIREYVEPIFDSCP